MSCHYKVDTVFVCVCVDEEQTLKPQSIHDSLEEGCPFGGAFCAKFIQMCSTDKEQILCWHVGFVSMLIPQCSLRQLSGCLNPKPCLLTFRETAIDYGCLLPGNQKYLTRAAQILRQFFTLYSQGQYWI